MTIEALGNAIRTRFKAEVADSHSGWDVFYDNDPTTEAPSGDKYWCRVKVDVNNAEQRAIGGNKRFRYSGQLIVQCYVPVGDGSDNLDGFIDSIINAFRSVTAGGVKYLTPYPSQTGRAGKWWQKNLNCPFWMYD